MRIRRLDSNNDWMFGRGTSNYALNDEAIKQNVASRLRSFKNDWLLDTDKNIDWLTILGQLNNEDTIRNEVQRVTLATEGVTEVVSIDIITDTNRHADISIVFNTVFSDLTRLGVTI